MGGIHRLCCILVETFNFFKVADDRMLVIMVLLQGLLCNYLVNLLIFEDVRYAAICVVSAELWRLDTRLIDLFGRVNRYRALVALASIPES